MPSEEAPSQRNFGEQPLALLLKTYHLKPHDLVSQSTEQITHKMISRAVKGRRLTLNVQTKILNALNRVLDKTYSLKDLFNY